MNKNNSISCDNNDDVIKNAINSLYGESEDFNIIGLTARTGSGASTIAKILSSSIGVIKSDFLNINSNSINYDRKDIIINKFFEETWSEFELIKVRDIIIKLVLDYKFDFNDLKNLSIDSNNEIENIENYQLKYNSIVLNLFELLYDFKKSNAKLIKKINNDIDYINLMLKIQILSKKITAQVNNKYLEIKLFQTFGYNLRKSGNAFGYGCETNCFFTIAKEIKIYIKHLKNIKSISEKKTNFVIDSIKNPLEAIYFQERYSSFYLLAVSCTETERVNRLINLGFSKEEVDNIDKIEDTSFDPTNFKTYVTQDIQSCIQKSDIFINNPDIKIEAKKFHDLAHQVIKFVVLMKRPGIITPTPLERCMQIALTAKANSGCISRQVGAVVTDSTYSVKAIGWNDVPQGQVPCNLRSRNNLINGTDLQAYSNFELNDKEYRVYFKEQKNNENNSEIIHDSFCFKDSYNSYEKANKLKKFKSNSNCDCNNSLNNFKFSNQVHTRSLHAEENAFLQISKNGGTGIKGGYLFTTASPCELCAKKAYQLGISKIFYIDPYPGIANTHILMGGEFNPELILFSGAIGRAFHKLYTPHMPYKDELAARIKMS